MGFRAAATPSSTTSHTRRRLQHGSIFPEARRSKDGNGSSFLLLATARCWRSGDPNNSATTPSTQVRAACSTERPIIARIHHRLSEPAWVVLLLLLLLSAITTAALVTAREKRRAIQPERPPKPSQESQPIPEEAMVTAEQVPKLKVRP